MERDLSLDNILTDEDISSLFEDDNIEETTSDETDDNKTKEDNKTTEVNVEELFTEPESVGRENNNNEEQEDTNDPNDDGASPNFFSSIAAALVDEGVFPDLNEDEISQIKGPEDFRDLIDRQIKSGIDEANQRVLEALNAGVEPTAIQNYERVLSYLNSIDDASLEDESEKGENLRKNIIYQDYINRGFSKERATKEVEKSFRAGTDIEDAKESLTGNKDFYQGQYDDLIKEGKEAEAKEAKKQKEQAEELKKSILTEKKVFGDIEIDKNTRQRVYDNVAKPIYKDPDSGEYLTAVQKYQREHPVEFSKNLGLLFTLTDGFKNIDTLVGGKVKKEVKKGLRELETKIRSTSSSTSGNLRFANGGYNDKESIFSKNFEIDI
ncbi:MAG: hypothetical protein UF228_00350 [Lachnospiraceae bacterium]|nr:hypothetical protein [Lachnospiraceae bacterium]